VRVLGTVLRPDRSGSYHATPSGDDLSATSRAHATVVRGRVQNDVGTIPGSPESARPCSPPKLLMRETKRSIGRRILAYSHQTGRQPAIRRIARKSAFASAYWISARELSFHSPVTLFPRFGGCMPACPRSGSAVRSGPTSAGERGRNSSHTLPRRANVQRSVQPAAIRAEHHGHARGHYRTLPRSPRQACVHLPGESRIEADREPRLSRGQRQMRLCRMRPNDLYARPAAAGQPAPDGAVRVADCSGLGYRDRLPGARFRSAGGAVTYLVSCMRTTFAPVPKIVSRSAASDLGRLLI
jgi:hypothetical protein